MKTNNGRLLETPVEILRTLVSIPSFVDESHNEVEICEYVYNYLKNFAYLKVTKQKVEEGRFNIIAKSRGAVKLAFFCHLDTVPPSPEWIHDPLSPKIDGGRLYGLGAADMKGGTAALLSALTEFSDPIGLYLVFDVDEEYYFKGIRKFIELNKIRPKLAILPEPGMEIRNGHRGVIEIEFIIEGRTGHPSDPKNGKNAIMGAIDALRFLEDQLERFRDNSLGKTTYNLAFISGGSKVSEKEGRNFRIVARGNRIPDFSKVLLEIRTSSKKLDARRTIEIIRTRLQKNGFKLTSAEVKIDRKPFFVGREKLAMLESAIKTETGSVKYCDITKTGYGEGQLLNEAFGITAVYFGPGPYKMAHKDNEYVLLDDLQKAKKVYINLINEYCK